jgi:hypothetical protein
VVRELHWVCWWAAGQLDLIAWELGRELKRKDPVARAHFVGELELLALECRRGIELIEKAEPSDAALGEYRELVSSCCQSAESFAPAERSNTAPEAQAVDPDFVAAFGKPVRDLLERFMRHASALECLLRTSTDQPVRSVRDCVYRK